MLCRNPYSARPDHQSSRSESLIESLAIVSSERGRNDGEPPDLIRTDDWAGNVLRNNSTGPIRNSSGDTLCDMVSY